MTYGHTADNQGKGNNYKRMLRRKLKFNLHFLKIILKRDEFSNNK